MELDDLRRQLATIEAYDVCGRVQACKGQAIYCDGLQTMASIGDICLVERGPTRMAGTSNRRGADEALVTEVMAIHHDAVVLLPYDGLEGIRLGTTVKLASGRQSIRPSPAWLGRIIDPMGKALDASGGLQEGPKDYPIRAKAVPAHLRQGLGDRLDLGVRAINLFAPCRRGQRLGIFAGTGVGKTTLLSMLAQHSGADALVLGLIGERGRELHDFIHGGLGADGLARSIVVVATSDMPAMQRRRAAETTMAIAEALRDQGLSVLCLIDSVTRYAMALREIYLAAGEPPTSRGYPPSVFTEMPKLLERAGPGEGAGSITGLFTVLVEGDDLNDPIADAVRGILDGHIVLDRKIAERGRFPAIDVLKSLSRTAPGCYQPDERPTIEQARHLLRVYEDVAELLQLGAYQTGIDPLTDRAIQCHPLIENLLKQREDEKSTIQDDFARLAGLLQQAADSS